MRSKGWKKVNWGSIATLEYGKSLRDYENGNGTVPVFGTNGQIGFTNKPLCSFPSVIVGRKGAYRGIHFCDRPFFVIDTVFYLKPKSDEINLKFAYYQLLTQDINGMDSGSAIPSTSRDDFYNLEVNLPPLETQTRIASILSALDEKIELNRQTNATLEAIAQAIFKEWFVDFRFPGATGKMQESELGPIPKGWRIGKLSEVCKNTRKTIHPKDVYSNTAYVGLEHIPRKSLGLASWGASGDVDSQKTYFKQFNVLFGKLRPYFHKVCIAPFDGICSTDILVIESHQMQYFSFALLHLFSNEMITFVSSVADGTRMPRVDWQSIGNYEIILPPEQLISEFHEVVFPFFIDIIENNQHANSLATLRGNLLPKLMSGEMEV